MSLFIMGLLHSALVELHREGSAPAACAAGLFKNKYVVFLAIMDMVSAKYDVLCLKEKVCFW